MILSSLDAAESEGPSIPSPPPPPIDIDALFMLPEEDAGTSPRLLLFAFIFGATFFFIAFLLFCRLFGLGFIASIDGCKEGGGGEIVRESRGGRGGA